jgi:hypothetical protein
MYNISYTTRNNCINHYGYIIDHERMLFHDDVNKRLKSVLGRLKPSQNVKH